MSSAIKYDFQTGQVSDVGIREGLGVALMRLAAKATRPIDRVGLSIATRVVKTVLPCERVVEAQLSPDTRFEFPYGDAYWGCLLDNAISYSPGCENFLLKMRDIDYAYIDCGANYGYMSALVTSHAYGHKSCIAIEADPDTFKILERNAELNKNRFELMNRAIFSKSGEMVNIYGAKHEARSILDNSGERHDGNVETLALNDLTGWLEKTGKTSVILKLDVEGVEIEAMKGASEFLTKDLLVMYEDHGSDKNHEVSRYFLETLGMQIFDTERGGCCRINSLEELAAIKTNPRVGYDFIATNSNHWLSKIEERFPAG